MGIGDYHYMVKQFEQLSIFFHYNLHLKNNLLLIIIIFILDLFVCNNRLIVFIKSFGIYIRKLMSFYYQCRAVQRNQH